MKTRVKQPLNTKSIYMTDMFRQIVFLSAKSIVENIYKYLYTIINRSNRMSFMDNKQITTNMLIDNKYINKTVFYIFLANIRFTMFK